MRMFWNKIELAVAPFVTKSTAKDQQINVKQRHCKKENSRHKEQLDAKPKLESFRGVVEAPAK